VNKSRKHPVDATVGEVEVTKSSICTIRKVHAVPVWLRILTRTTLDLYAKVAQAIEQLESSHEKRYTTRQQSYRLLSMGIEHLIIEGQLTRYDN
jgi:hypothetical protein